jgi:RHS repeat-associated protein
VAPASGAATLGLGFTWQPDGRLSTVTDPAGTGRAASYRDYDPSLGRYMEADPLGIDAGRNVYAYVDGDPVNEEDRRGLMGAPPSPPAPAAEFKWYGNYGGPGWSSGGWRPEDGPIPQPGQPGYKPPIDQQDACYEKHDRCIHNCTNCELPGHYCIRSCDRNLHLCLDMISTKTIQSIMTSVGFSWLIPQYFH